MARKSFFQRLRQFFGRVSYLLNKAEYNTETLRSMRDFQHAQTQVLDELNKHVSVVAAEKADLILGEQNTATIRVMSGLAETTRSLQSGVESTYAQAFQAQALLQERLPLIESNMIGIAETTKSLQSGVEATYAQAFQAQALIQERLPLIESNLLGLASRIEQMRSGLRIGLVTSDAGGSIAQSLYLDLIESALTGLLFRDGRLQSGAVVGHDPLSRSTGFDWPETAETMIGTARMRNLRMLAERALTEGVEGDFLEAGVWRGGACIYLAAILAAYNDQARRVFVADSFAGLPPPNVEAYPADSGDLHHEQAELRVSVDQVRDNFRRYGLLSEQIVFLEGWFKDTLPKAPIEKLAILRLDGDMYESTIQTLDALYNKVSPGGFVIIDDYILKPCAQAVDEFRSAHGIIAPLQQVDSAAVWWQVPPGDRAHID